MPNNIKNRVIIHGTPEQVQDVFEQFSTHYPAALRKSREGNLICVDKESGEFQGWFNPKDCIFMLASDRKEISGLPENLDFEIEVAWDRFPDLDKIVPMPEILKDLEPHSGIVNAVKKKYNASVSTDPILAAMQLHNRMDQTLEFEGRDKEMFDKCCKAYEETGFAYWYDWSIANWGTKWNTYECERESYATFTFETAWSGILNMIQRMSAGCPGIQIRYEYADEDIGYNCGEYTLLDGEIIHENTPEGGSREAYELAFKLRPEYRDYYELKDGVYVGKED